MDNMNYDYESQTWRLFFSFSPNRRTMEIQRRATVDHGVTYHHSDVSSSRQVGYKPLSQHEDSATFGGEEGPLAAGYDDDEEDNCQGEAIVAPPVE